jgi:hypothetical protein
MSNLCQAEQLICTCSESDWSGQEYCIYSEKSPKRNQCIFYHEHGGWCDNPEAQEDARK